MTPDIVLPDGLRYLKTGEKYLEYSLPWDTVTPTAFTKVAPEGDSSGCDQGRQPPAG